MFAPSRARIHSPVAQYRACFPIADRSRGRTVARAGKEIQGNTADVAQRSTAVQVKEGTGQEEPWKWEESWDAQRAHAILAAVLVAGTLPALQEWNKTSIFYFTALAVSTIYIGAHKGLTTGLRQQISVKEGLLAPVAASISLFGIYLILTYLPDLSLQTFLDCYFFLLGSFSVAAGAASLLKAVPSLATKNIVLDLPPWLLIGEDGKPIEQSNNAPADLLGLVVGVAIAGAEVAAHHSNFTLSNLVACMVASDILQLVGIRSFRTSVVLLVGLLAYDVFWVFYSPIFTGGDSVMEAVATSDIMNAPTRLLYPRIPGGIADIGTFPYSLLGLGDVAVPGLLAGLALRYDSSRVVDMQPRAVASFSAIDEALNGLPPGADRNTMRDAAAKAASTAYDDVADEDDARRNATTSSTGVGEPTSRVLFSDAVLQQRRYFTPVMVAYVCGLTIAFVANSVTGTGQPALLYLCPATLGAVLLTAASRREIMRVWSFVDLPSNVPKMPSSDEKPL